MRDVNATLTALAAAYLQPWRGGVTQAAINYAHINWADYRDAQWGGYVPLGTAHNRLLRVNILAGKLHYVTCAGSKSVRRIARQRALLRLLQSVIERHAIPDLDLVLSISDRPTVPKLAVADGSTPPPVFGYAKTDRHYSLPFPPVSFDPTRWPALYARVGSHPPLAARTPKALWRGTCNSLCDMMRSRRCKLPRDAELLPRLQLLTAASRCPRATDVGITSAHKNCVGFEAKSPVPISEHASYALHLHVDGNGFSGRLDELLTLGGAVLKQDSPFAAYYYPLLRRGVHFQPLARNLSNLCSASGALLADLADLAGRSHQMASAASRFARRFLSPEAVALYVVALLRQYAQLQRFVPRLHPQAVPWRDDGGGHSQRSDTRKSADQAQRSMVAAAAACSSPACCQRHPKACAHRTLN